MNLVTLCSTLHYNMYLLIFSSTSVNPWIVDIINPECVNRVSYTISLLAAEAYGWRLDRGVCVFF